MEPLRTPGGYVVPLIHSNGNSRDELLAQFVEAANAVRAAISKVGDIDLNLRNYYPYGDNAWTSARDVHMIEMDNLRHVETYLSEIAIGIDQQTRGR